MPMRPSDTIHGGSRGSPETAMTFARNVDSKRLDQLDRYVTEAYALAPRVGIDPAIVVAQGALETDNWRDRWWAERLNPAGLGITGDPDQNERSRNWDSGADAARAQIVHLSLYARGKPLPPELEPHAHLDPRRDAIAAEVLGQRRTLESLGRFWASVADYGQRICNRSQSVFPDLPNQNASDIVSTTLTPHPMPEPHETKITNGNVFWKIDDDVRATSEVRPKEWADPASRNAPDDATISEGQIVHVQYLTVGSDGQPWLITDPGWRVPARAFVPNG